ncbi:MAG: hypothetical protein ACREQV_10515 [Candidatus Binatia bacterium]
MKYSILVFLLFFFCAVDVDNAHSQTDPQMAVAILERLTAMQTEYENAHSLLLREGVFSLSRHNVQHSFRQPVRVWTGSEMELLQRATKIRGSDVRFCSGECSEKMHSEWIVTMGVAKELADERAAVPVQVSGSSEKMSWNVVYEFILSQSRDALWSVTEVLPGASSDAIQCDDLTSGKC